MAHIFELIVSAELDGGVSSASLTEASGRRLETRRRLDDF